jgi:hypothetical protein
VKHTRCVADTQGARVSFDFRYWVFATGKQTWRIRLEHVNVRQHRNTPVTLSGVKEPSVGIRLSERRTASDMESGATQEIN